MEDVGGNMILDELKNTCMLEVGCQEGSLNEYVKIHDLIRDIIIAITRVSPLLMI